LAAMGAKEAALILDLISDLKNRGEVSIIIVAHNYGQVLEICDRINLLQHGEITFDKLSKDTSVQELNDIVIKEYRRALEERRRRARPRRGQGRGTPPGAARWLPCRPPAARGSCSHAGTSP